MIANSPGAPGLFSIVQGVKAQTARVTPPAMLPNIPGRAAGGPVNFSQPDMAAADAMNGYASMASGPADAGGPTGPTAPTGASLVPQGAVDPNLQIYIALAMKYGLVTPDGQPDIAKAQQMLAQNPSLADQLAQPAQSAASLPNTPGMPDMSAPAVPGRMDGGPVHVAGYYTGIDPADYGPAAGSQPAGPAGNAPGGNPAPNPDNFYISQIVGILPPNPDGSAATFDDAVSMWNDMSDAQKANWRTSIDRKVNPNGPGGGSSDAATYASIAERANEAAQQLAFDKVKEQHQMAMARQQAAADASKAATDFSLNQEALKTARKQAHNDAVTSALNAWTANVGKANVPGWQNWRMEGGQASNDIMSGAPLLNFNPLEAYGKQLSEPAQLTAPNIPSIDFGAAA